MNRGHIIELKPNNKQATYFAKACGIARLSYNWALNEWQKQYDEDKKYRDECLQLGLEIDESKLNKPEKGHFAKAKLAKDLMLEVSWFDENINYKAYKMFLEKIESSIYQGVYKEKFYKKVNSYYDAFSQLDVIEQSRVILELLHLFDTTAVVPNLKEIGGPTHFGVLTLNKDITDKTLNIVNTSITGLFENKIRIGDL